MPPRPLSYSTETRLALLEQDQVRLEQAMFGFDGESGINGRLTRVERLAARIGGMAALGAVLGGVIADLSARLVS